MVFYSWSKTNSKMDSMHTLSDVLHPILQGKNPVEITERKLEETLRLYTKFGRIAKRGTAINGKENSHVEEPFVLFGINTQKQLLARADQTRGQDMKEEARHSLSAEEKTHMIIKAVEPLTGISCTRTYFLTNSWENDSTDASILARIYADIVDIALKAIDTLTNSTSCSLTKRLVKDHFTKKFEELPENVSHDGWDFRIEALGPDGISFPLKDEVPRSCYKKVTILVYEVAVRDAGSKLERKLGSLAFAETFVDSHVTTRDLKGRMGRRDQVFILTQGEIVQKNNVKIVL